MIGWTFSLASPINFRLVLWVWSAWGRRGDFNAPAVIRTQVRQSCRLECYAIHLLVMGLLPWLGFALFKKMIFRSAKVAPHLLVSPLLTYCTAFWFSYSGLFSFVFIFSQCALSNISHTTALVCTKWSIYISYFCSLVFRLKSFSLLCERQWISNSELLQILE